MNTTETITAPIAAASSTDTTLDVELTAGHSHGTHEAWGDARVFRGTTIDAILPGEILVTDDLTPDMLSYLPVCVGVIITSSGPFESATPGILHDDFTRSGAAALLRAFDIPHTWNTPDATAKITTGDLVHLDPATRTIWALPVG